MNMESSNETLDCDECGGPLDEEDCEGIRIWICPHCDAGIKV